MSFEKRQKERLTIRNLIGDKKGIRISAKIQKKNKCIKITIKNKSHLKRDEFSLFKIKENYKIFNTPLALRTYSVQKELKKGVSSEILQRKNESVMQLEENKKTCVTFFLTTKNNASDLVIPVCEIFINTKSKRPKNEYNKQHKKQSSILGRAKLRLNYLCKKIDKQFLFLKANDIVENKGLKNYLRLQQRKLKKIFILRKLCKKRNESDYTHFMQASVLGKTRCIIQKDICFLEHLSSARQIKNYITQEEYAAGIKFENQNIILQVEKRKYLKGKWISLLHPGSENLMHWVAEVMPRLFLESELSEDVGILVDDSLPSNMYDLLKIACLKKTIYKVSKYELVTVDILICPSLCNYSLLWEKGTKFLGGDWYLNKSSIQNMSLKLNSLIPATYSNGAENIYLTRRANFRRVLNEKSLWKSLKRTGYKSIFLSHENLLETLKKLKNAKNLLLQAGATFGNIIFIEKTCNIFVIVPPTNRIHRKLFTEFAGALNHKVQFISGYEKKRRQKYSESLNYTFRHPLNTDFHVDIKKIQRTISQENKI